MFVGNWAIEAKLFPIDTAIALRTNSASLTGR